MGYLYKLAKQGPRARYWWACWKDTNGKRIQESTKREDQRSAKKFLREREAAVDRKEPIKKGAGSLKLKDALRAVIDDMKMNNKASHADQQRRIDKHLLDFFDGNQQLASVGTREGRAYATHRKTQGAANESINKELRLLQRAYNLAIADKELMYAPKFAFLEPAPPRTGFLQRPELDAITAHLPPWLRGAVVALYVLGWRRKSEVLGLRVDQVNLADGTIYLEAAQTKTREPRVVYMTGEVKGIIRQQLASVERLKKRKKNPLITQWLFHRPRTGRQLKSFRKRWVKACIDAGFPGKLLHDFRRSAARNLTKSGTPEQTAMAILGHASSSTFRRYRILDEREKQEAVQRLESFFADTKKRTKAAAKVRPFTRGARKAG